MATVTVREIYSDSYAEIYRQIYIDHPMWSEKHEVNIRNVRALLPPGGRWLDTCCGQAWHFTQLPEIADKTGIDLSPAQLARARAANPRARFIEGDVLECDLHGEQFDLVTNFWGSYSYLDDEERIAALVERMIGWCAPGGAVYLELITPETLAAFNATDFAADTDSQTILRSPDSVKWGYQDPGGYHDLTSPPAGFFDRLLRPWFDAVEGQEVVTTMRQLVATGKLSRS